MAGDFDWSLLEQPYAMAMVRSQLGFSWLVLVADLERLSDHEWAWEPTPDAYAGAPTPTVHPRGAHLTEAFSMRYDYTFGSHTGPRDDVRFAGNAAGAVAALADQVGAWDSR